MTQPEYKTPNIPDLIKRWENNLLQLNEEISKKLLQRDVLVGHLRELKGELGGIAVHRR